VPPQIDPEAEWIKAQIQRDTLKTQSDIANQQAITNARIENIHREAEARNAIKLRNAQAENMNNMLTSTPLTGPDGASVQAGGEGVTLVMSIVDEMRRDMKTLADSINTPKQIIRDPQSGEITAVVPMRVN
jgi:hypothetical protein